MTQDNIIDTPIDPKALPFILSTDHDDPDAAIIVDNVTVKTPGLRGRTLVKDASFRLERGRRYVMTGKSGTGKTITTKAFAGLWDPGNGVIRIDPNLKIGILPQQPYFPDTDLRSILNMKPEGQHTIPDEELTDMLRKIGLPQLIQYIPGQQTGILLDGLAEKLPDLMKETIDARSDRVNIRALSHLIMGEAIRQIGEQFDNVQFIPESQRQKFRDEAVAVLLGAMPDKKSAQRFCDDILQQIDQELALPFLTILTDTIPARARRCNGIFVGLGVAKKEMLARMIGRRLNSRFISYINNDDTDDKHRKPGINKVQAAYIAKAFAAEMERGLKEESSTALSRTFNSLAIKLVIKPLAFIFNRAIAPAGNFLVVKPALFVHRRALKPLAEAFIAPPLRYTFQHASQIAGAMNEFIATYTPSLIKAPALYTAHVASYLGKHAAHLGYRGLKGLFNASVSAARGLLKTAYAMTWPVRFAVKAAFFPLAALSLHFRARGQVKEILETTTTFLERQQLRGSDLTYGTRLSGGQKQKLSIAMALLQRPDILIADEMTAPLDEETGEEIYETLIDSLPEGTTLCSIAHNSYVKKYHTDHLHIADQEITLREIPENERHTAPAPS